MEAEGLSIYQQGVYDAILRATPDLSEEDARAAVSWIRSGELCRHYGPGFIIAYSIRAMRKVALHPEGLPDGVELEPAERIALLAAESALGRGENPPINTTAVVVQALARLRVGAGPIGQEERESG